MKRFHLVWDKSAREMYGVDSLGLISGFDFKNGDEFKRHAQPSSR